MLYFATFSRKVYNKIEEIEYRCDLSMSPPPNKKTPNGEEPARPTLREDSNAPFLCSLAPQRIKGVFPG